MLYGAKYEALVDAVKGHAVRNYEKDGWDYIVECYGDGDIASIIQAANATTREEAIKAVGDYIKVKDDYRSDIMGA
tara:strand:+ start:226 stop:453 length:228 start_codon:yes stop_codon:yes gene_type:complete